MIWIGPCVLRHWMPCGAAACREWEPVHQALSEAEQQIEGAAQQEMRRHAASRVQFNTLDADK